MVALVLSALWLSGLAPIRYAGSTAISARVTGLEMQVKSIAQDLANKPAADMGALDQIKERVGKVEQSLAKIPSGDPAAAERATAAENSMKSLGIALAALTRRADEIAGNATATRDEVATLQKRMDALEVAVKTTQEKVAASSNADNAARLALAAAALRDAVARGEPYTSQLAAIRSLGADAKPLAALEPFAASGIPTDAALSRELAALLPAMRDVAGPDTVAPAGFLDRLQANASKLVRVRPTGAPAGDDPSAILARLEVKIARNDVSGAQADIAKLPLKSRTLAEAWSRKADARKKTLTAAAAISAEAARSLGHPPKLP
ncbi:MAG: COG4223 family protein [Pseudolabrys sp.]